MKKQKPYSKQIIYREECTKWIAQYDVVWRSQSTCSRDSMPLGDGDTGYNVWVEKDNGLFLLIGRSDTLLHNKLGRLHITTEPNIFEGDHFVQKLCLEEGHIEIQTEQGNLTIWVDASEGFEELSVLHIEGNLSCKVKVCATYELWRAFETFDDMNEDLGMLSHHDNVWNSNDQVVWTHHHQKYGCRYNMVVGGTLSGDQLEKVSETQIVSREPISRIHISAYIFAEDMQYAKEWYESLISQKREYEKSSLLEHYSEHKAWWRRFWQRSKIVMSKVGIAHRVNSQYLLQRFMFACSSRGLLPSLYNGSIFRTELEQDSNIAFGWMSDEKTDADMRPWGEDYMGQNTRHQYWPLIATGDYDLMEPIIRLIRGRVKYQLKETWETMGHQGGFTQEKFPDCGFTWDESDMEELPEESRGVRKEESWENREWHLQYHFLPTIEFVAMFLDLYKHNTDEKFLNEVVLPCLDMCIDFYDNHYPDKNELGKRVIYPAGTAETYGKARSGYHDLPQREHVTNPVSEVAGLRYILTGVLALSDEEITQTRRERLEKYYAELPEVPTKIYAETILLAPGEKYSPGLLCETNELYAVWPFRQNTFYKSNKLDSIGRQSLFTRRISLDGSTDIQSWETGGWHPAGIDAATLGLPKEAAKILEMNFSDTLPTVAIIQEAEYQDKNTVPRFEGFWNYPHMDGIPDQCHAGVSMNILQSMLLQWDGEKIFLMPAWENSWDVEFKLFAPKNTIVECTFADGKIKSLKVTPEYRKKDIINCQAVEYQLKNMIRIRANDRNSFFGLPPMRDGVLSKDDFIYKPTLKPWLMKYSQSVMNVKPYYLQMGETYCLYKDNVLYLHVLEKAKDLVVPIQNMNVKRAECLTGGEVSYLIEDNELKLDVSACQEDIITIIKITTDKMVMPLMDNSHVQCSYQVSSTMSEHFRSSHMGDASSKMFWYRDEADDAPWVCCEMENVKTLSRAEIRLKTDEVGMEKRIGMTIEYKDEVGKWSKLFETIIFGEHWSQKFGPINTDQVRFRFEKDKDFGIRFIGLYE